MAYLGCSGLLVCPPGDLLPPPGQGVVRRGCGGGEVGGAVQAGPLVGGAAAGLRRVGHHQARPRPASPCWGCHCLHCTQVSQTWEITFVAGPRSWYLYPRTQLRTERTPLILPNTREASLVAAGVHQAPLVASEEVKTLSL